MSKLPKGFNEQKLLNFIYASFQHRYVSSVMNADDTPTGDAPSFRWEPDEWPNWKYEDRFYGGEPFAGNIQIFYKGVPCWYMDIQGSVIDDLDQETISQIYDCLGEALAKAPQDAPYRGPSQYESKNGFIYDNRHTEGDVMKFSGRECIWYHPNRKIPIHYKAKYSGGIINRR